MNSDTPSDRQAPVPHTGLVLGTMALQLGLVSREQLCEVLQAWLQDPADSIGDMLVNAGYLAIEDKTMLQALVLRHISGAKDLGAEKLHPVRDIAALTVGRVRTAAPVDVARSLLQTLREQVSPDDSPTRTSRLTELNPSNQRFRILRPYALGGLGLVSVAYDEELKREVAVKEMRLDNPSEEAVQRFTLEARVTGQLDHPGIPPVYALGYFEDGRPFYVMRLIDGITLKAAIAAFHNRYPPPDRSRQRSLELRQLLGAMVSVCHTLRFAHSRHVLHRDIKPSNIMIGEYGETLVLDWGLAKSKEQSMPFSVLDAKAHQSRRRSDDPTQTGTGSVLGTPHYMSPEQARGEWESVNFRSDVYSLGATLYTLLTGKLPFSGRTREDVLEQVRRGAIERPSTVDARIPAELDAICMKAMALEREDRFASTGELATEIEHWLADEPVASYNETVTRKWRRWLKARQSLVAALVALLVTGLLGLAAGVVAVSLEHSLALKERSRANMESERAAKVADEARELVATFLVASTNHRLSQMRGTEKLRVRMLENGIKLLQQWAMEDPSNLHRKLDLAKAIRQRALLRASLNEVDAAWADMTLALSILDELQQVPEDTLRGSVVFTRLYLLTEMAALMAQTQEHEHTLDFIQYVQHLAKRAVQQKSVIPSRLALSSINLVLARQLTQMGRHLEASELVDAASSHLDRMLTEVDASSVESTLVDGRTTIVRLACEACCLQAFISKELGDLQFAEQRATRTLQLCKDILRESPEDQAMVRTRLETLLLKAEMAATDDFSPAALGQLQATVTEIDQAAAHFPNSAHVTMLAARAQVTLATHEFRGGTVKRAQVAARHAITAHSQIPQTYRTLPKLQLELARAQRIAAETSLIQGDSPAAQSHSFAARAALAPIDCWPEAEDAASERSYLGLIEQQLECFRCPPLSTSQPAH